MKPELTQLERKVYDCVKRNDDGKGLPAAFYCLLLKTQDVPDISPGTTDEEFADSLRNVMKYQDELNITEEKCEQTLNSLVEKGYLITYESIGGDALYTINKAMVKQDAPMVNFFCSTELFGPLCDLKRNFLTADIRDYTMDLIEIPFQVKVTSDPDNRYLTLYTRNELYFPPAENSIESGSLTLSRTTGEGAGNITQSAYIKDFNQLLSVSFALGCLIAEKGWDKEYAGLDPNESGLMLTYRDGDFSVKPVSGDERPDLMCKLMFGGAEMCRPYMDDFWERSALDMMSPEELIQAAEDGDEEAMQRLAMVYLTGDDGFEVDAEKAVYWNTKLAELGDPTGMFNLGLHTAKGFGTPRNFALAAEWMDKAAAAGDTDASRAAEEYHRLADNLEKAEAGDAQAQAYLAEGYMKLGNSLDQAGPGEDYKESVKWAEKAAEQGDGDGLWVLALAYEHGRGVTQDKKKAVELYQIGADVGHAKCQHSLGCYYGRGEVLPKDEKKAFDLFTKSAEQGYGLAMQGLGSCYQFGTGTDHDMDKAIEWYEKSLEVQYDPELARKVAILKQLEKVGESETENTVARKDPSRFDLSYKKDIRCGDEKYSIGIPDSFEIDKNVEDRAFIAWLPDGAADYNEAKIVFYDGKIVSENDNDSRLYTPESSAAFLENSFWNSPLHSIFQSAKVIPLSERSPGGIIIAQYELNNVETAFHYNIQLCFKGYVKGMRVMVLDVTEEDIPACDKMVVNWMNTLELTEPLDVAKKLDDPSFTSAELTEEIVDEWKSCSDALYSIIFLTFEQRMAARSGKYYVHIDNGDSRDDVIKDGQKYIETAASDYSHFLKSALDGLEAITETNEGNPLLKKLYEVILPCFTKEDYLSVNSIGSVRGTVSAPIPGFKDVQKRFLALMPEAENEIEGDLAADNDKDITFDRKSTEKQYAELDDYDQDDESTAKTSPELQKKANDFYKEKKAQFERFKRDWEDLCSEAPDKLNQLVRKGIKPSISRGNPNSRSSGSRTLTMNISFESNMDAAKEYVNELKTQIENTVNENSKILSEMSKRMDEFKEEGLDFDTFKPLIDLFIDWADYCGKKPLQIAKNTIELGLSDEAQAVRDKWADYRIKRLRIIEAHKYGVPVRDLDRHKKYLDAKKIMHSAKTSSEMEKAHQMFSSLNGYEDSKKLADECHEKKDVLKEQEEERRKKEAEAKRKAEEEKRKNNVYSEAVALGAKKDSKSIGKAIDKLKSIPGWKDSEALLDEYSKNLEKVLEEEAERERERLRIEELKKQYKEKYDPLTARKTENEKILEESLKKKEESDKKGSGGILLGWGVFQTVLGAVVSVLTDSTVVGIINVIFGVLIFWLGLGVRKNKRTELEGLTKKIDDANAVLKDIEEIPTFDEFCYSLTDEGIEEARRKEEERISEIYQDAASKAKSVDKDVLCEARNLFKSIADKRDVTKELAECENNILLADKQIAKKKRNKKVIIILALALVVLAAVGLAINSNIQKKNKAAFEAELSAVNWYQFDDKGVPELMFDFDSDGTAELRSDFDVLENKWDDKDYFEWTVITANKDRAAFTVKMKNSDDPAISMIAEKGDEGNFDKISADDGSEEFVAMNKKDFDKIVEELANEENYKTACSLLDEGKLSEAYDLFSSMKDYKDSGEKATAIFEQIKENNTRFFELAQKAAETDLGSAGEYLDQISGYFAPAGELQKLYNRFSPYSGSFTLNNYLKDEIVSIFSLAPDGTVKWKATTKDGKAITINSKEVNCNTETAVKENYNGTNKYYAEFMYADKPAYAIFSNNKIEFYVVNTLRQNLQYYSYFAEKK